MPIQETIKICLNKELKMPFCKKLIFEKLLSELTRKCVFLEIDDCPLEGSISVVLWDIVVCKIKKDIVAL